MQPDDPPSPEPKTGRKIAIWATVLTALAATMSVAMWAFGSESTPVHPGEPPDKYSSADFASCTDFPRRSPALPRETHQRVRNWAPDLIKIGRLLCEFAPAPGEPATVSVHVAWYGTTDMWSGTENAYRDYAAGWDRNQDDHPIEIGSGGEARWAVETDPKKCAVTVLDGNATYLVRYTTADGNQQTCRTQAVAVAQGVFLAAQHR